MANSAGTGKRVAPGQTTRELTPRGQALMLLAIATFAVSIIVGHANTRIAFTLLAAPLVVDAVFGGRRLRHLAAAIQPRRVEAGQLFRERIQLTNLGRGAQEGIQLIEPRTAMAGSKVFVEHLGGYEDLSVEVPARARRRGYFERRSIVLRSAEPLGLIRRSRILEVGSELTIEPARVDLPLHVVKALARSGTDHAQRVEPTTGGEFFALREYVVGDDARSVHALRSAATDTLVRTERRGTRPDDLCVVIDLRRPPGRPPRTKHGGIRLEWSLGVAATLADGRTPSPEAVRVRMFVIGSQARPEPDRPFWLTDQSDEHDRLLEILARARTVRHTSLEADLQTAIGEHGTCLWIPAGGYRAAAERASLQRCILVSREDES